MRERLSSFGVEGHCEDCVYFNDESSECECEDSENWYEEVDELDTCTHFEEA